MPWILLAVIAHALNAIVFAVDKNLLTSNSPINNPLRYAAYSGLVAGGAGLILPFAYAAPNNFIILWSLLAGVLWTAALWFFFIALKYGEPSRAVPVIGSAVPLFTLILAITLLGEQLTGQQITGALALIVGGILLTISWRGTRGLSSKSLRAAIAGGAAFAAYFVTVDFVYDHFDPFLAAFAYSRLGVGIVSGILLLAISIRQQPAKQTIKKSRRPINQISHPAWLIPIAFIISKGIGTIALILQNWAIALGSVSIVNALQGTQYIILLGLAAGVSRFFPALFREELNQVAVTQKVLGIVAVGLGLITIAI